jgi:Family of unknown function (DUF6677)
MAPKEATIESAKRVPIPFAVLIAAWLLPGGGHLWQRRWGRGALLLGSIGLMFSLGLALGGRFFHGSLIEIAEYPFEVLWSFLALLFGKPPALSFDFVEQLGYLGDVGSGLFFGAANFWGYNAPAVAAPAADYGTKFLLVAGLLNVLCILDAYDIAVGNKP